MNPQTEKTAEILYQHGITSEQELISIKAYRSLNVFSVRYELLSLVYISILLLSGGIGILVYENIDTIGHSILIALVFIGAAACYYFSFKKAPPFSFNEAFFDNPLLDYVVLFGALLSGTFFGYLQYQYSPFGNSFAIASFLTSVVAIASAYRFDNRSSLSIGITTLAATVGITMTPQAVLELDVFENVPMLYTSIALGIALIVWGEFSERRNLKKHFAPFFYGFAQHLIGISCIVGMVQEFWGIFAFVMALSMIYLFRKSHQAESTALFVFTILYAFIGFNIAIVRMLILTGADDLILLCAYLAPFFYLGSIVLFIRSIRKFNKEHR
ncbi:DUF2157 domain-containing protein [Flavobacterium selenitireducens]|uniref:DUF2157 domain-containing protein n=1 Tax=Flavobacterium selenitireducens TaxID=2722704 RepID=UPI00168BDC17|nr:DUF2157 domain-containing protein [Flavobacterium selenitireducens]MBD3583728.1 DUF2157 domain-containing protein [Flavobacterium selenitireducens]